MAKRQRLEVTEAVEWAAANYEACVVENATTGARTIEWGRATSKPPNAVAKSYLKFAATNPSHFFSRTVPQFLTAGNDASDIPLEEIAEERKAVQSMRSILKQYVEAG